MVIQYQIACTQAAVVRAASRAHPRAPSPRHAPQAQRMEPAPAPPAASSGGGGGRLTTNATGPRIRGPSYCPHKPAWQSEASAVTHKRQDCEGVGYATICTNPGTTAPAMLHLGWGPPASQDAAPPARNATQVRASGARSHIGAYHLVLCAGSVPAISCREITDGPVTGGVRNHRGLVSWRCPLRHMLPRLTRWPRRQVP